MRGQTMTRTVVGVAWYSRATWTELRARAPDAADLENTYEDWLEVFHRGVAQVQAAGVRPERVEVDMQAFVAWCAPTGRALDSAARAEFVSEQLRLHDSGRGGIAE